MVNSSGSVERFALAPGESKTFEVLHPGNCNWAIDASAEIYQDQTGAMSGTTASVAVQGSEDNITFGSAITTLAPVPGATVNGSAVVPGKFTRFINNATTGLVWVVAKPSHRVQPATSL